MLSKAAPLLLAARQNLFKLDSTGPVEPLLTEFLVGGVVGGDAAEVEVAFEIGDDFF